MSNIEMVAAELAAAKRKHRRFVHQFYRPDPDTTIQRQLCAARELLKDTNREKVSDFGDVLMEEFFEVMEAYAKGELAHAREELAQCAAVCIRGMEYIENEMKGGAE